MNFKKYAPLSLMILLHGCFSSPPIWIDNRPNDLKYWHGIGFANHSDSNNPKTLAKESAIHEVSSQINILPVFLSITLIYKILFLSIIVLIGLFLRFAFIEILSANSSCFFLINKNRLYF